MKRQSLVDVGWALLGSLGFLLIAPLLLRLIGWWMHVAGATP